VSVIAFGRTRAKLEDEGFFIGFPSYWNVVAFYAGWMAIHYGTLLPDIAEIFVNLLDEAKGRRRVYVSSGKPLGREEESHIRDRLKDILRHDVDIDFATNPALMAGVQIRIDSTVYDSTIRTRLTGIQSLLTKE
jgi:F0F1-type ATP synthase delta subunit